MTDIAFRGNSLQTDNIITSQIDDNGFPDMKVNILAIAHANRSRVTGKEFPQKIIPVSGMLKADTIAEFDDLLDEFKGYFTGFDGELDIQHGASTRRYIGTLMGTPEIPREGGLMHSTFSIQFACQPFGRDIDLTELANVTGATTIPATTSIDVGGNAEFQFPIIEITIVDATNVENATVSITNNNNGQVCNIMRSTWSPGDVIKIDPYESDVLVNDVEVPFTGSIPIFNKGMGSLSISDTFNTREYDYTVNQYRYWL